MCVKPNLHLSKKQMNKKKHIEEGNKSAKCLKLTHWNPGSTQLENKMTVLEALISKKHHTYWR